MTKDKLLTLVKAMYENSSFIANYWAKQEETEMKEYSKGQAMAYRIISYMLEDENFANEQYKIFFQDTSKD